VVAAAKVRHERPDWISCRWTALNATVILRSSREEADYWTTFTDAQGGRLLGSGNYRLHLPPGSLPSNAFWSFTSDEIDKDVQFLTANPINRYEVSSFSSGLMRNADRSIDIWIRSTPGRRRRWLIGCPVLQGKAIHSLRTVLRTES